MSSGTDWRPTAAHARAVLGSIVLSALAVGLRRPDLLVLATPLLIAAVAGRKSTRLGTPAVDQRIGHDSLTEGEATTYHIRVHDPSEQTETIAAVLRPQRWIDLRPEHGQIAARARRDSSTHTLDVVVRPTRWGNYTVGPALVVGTSSWGAYRWSAPLAGATQRLQVFPQSSAHGTGTGSLVAAPGLVGSHRSPRYGSGAEFATIRPFVAGDRLHRIRWSHSLRAGTLQVASTWPTRTATSSWSSTRSSTSDSAQGSTVWHPVSTSRCALSPPLPSTTSVRATACRW